MCVKCNSGPIFATAECILVVRFWERVCGSCCPDVINDYQLSQLFQNSQKDECLTISREQTPHLFVAQHIWTFEQSKLNCNSKFSRKIVVICTIIVSSRNHQWAAQTHVHEISQRRILTIASGYKCGFLCGKTLKKK